MQPLHSVSAGDGATVLLIHGLGDRHRAWTALTPHLTAAGLRVLAVDLPGHGLSRGPEWTVPATLRRIVLTAESRGTGEVHLVGNSFGGYLALELAAEGFGSSVTALAPAGFAPPGHLIRAGGVLARHRLADATARGEQTEPGRSAPRVRRLVSGARKQSSWSGFVRYLGPGLFARFRSSIDVPATIAWGDSDPILDTRGIRSAALKDPEIRWVEIKDCGHFPMKEAVFETSDLITDTIGRARMTPGQYLPRAASLPRERGPRIDSER